MYSQTCGTSFEQCRFRLSLCLSLILFTPANMKKLFVLLAFAGVASAASAVDLAGNTGKVNVSMCIGCHGIPGYKATFPEVYQVPMLGGQSAKYIENALKAYQKGERKHPSMQGIAASLSDKDIAELAAYYSQQK
jgi:cytochrome c553